MAKVTFSDKELIMMNDSNLMPDKQRIIAKAEQIMGTIGTQVMEELPAPAPLSHLYKITKGENLEAQPFVVLDMPQIKTMHQLCHFRMLYWWGNYVKHSIFLTDIPEHNSIIEIIKSQFQYWTIRTSNQIWQHQATENIPVTQVSSAQILAYYQLFGFIRLDLIFPIHSLNHIEQYQTSLSSFKYIYSSYHGIH